MRRAAALVLPLLLACGGSAGTVQQLPSGHRFRILRAGQVRFQTTGETAAMPVYETGRKPDTAKGLGPRRRGRVGHFRPEVEKTPQRAAIIQANSPERGFLLKGQALAGFQWERGADGAWTRKIEEKK